MATSTISSTISDQLDKIESNLPTIPAKVMRLQRTIAGVAFGAAQALAGSTKDVIDIARVGGKTVTGQARAARQDVSRSARFGANAVVGQTKAVVGQTRAATKRITDAGVVGARTVKGQASAQGRRVTSSAGHEIVGLIDSAVDSVKAAGDTLDSGAGTRPASTRSSKLRTPARSRATSAATPTTRVANSDASEGTGPYESRTKAQLLERASELKIKGRFGMSKGELIDALRDH